MTKNQDLSTYPVSLVVKLTNPKINVILDQTQIIDCLHRKDGRKDRSGSTKKCSKQFRCECSSCSPNVKLKTPRPHSGAACDRPETIKTTQLPPISHVVWRQLPETSINKYIWNHTDNDSTL